MSAQQVNELGPWLSLTAAVAAASVSAAPPAGDADPARNQCRAACGDAWIVSQQCKPRKDVLVAEPLTRCVKRADTAYKACLVSCEPPGSVRPAPAKAAPKTPPKPAVKASRPKL